MSTLHVPLADRSYDVHLATFSPEEVVQALALGLGTPTGVAVLVDSNLVRVSPRVGPLVQALAERFPHVNVHELPAGEAAKNLPEVERTCAWLVSQGYDRGAAILGLGGGATTDHAGFVAAIYLRGVRFALCPTTLLAMVDASVGGKTGVDLAAGKNLVGAFYQPRAVVADVGFLDSLPRREQAAGMAEVVKAALIADAPLFEKLEAAADFWAQKPLLDVAIAAAIQVKIGVVSEDERESGRRAILNFGHTLGHAIESASDYRLLHGEAVSLGMVAALALGERRGHTTPGLRTRAERLLARLGLPVEVRPYMEPSVLARVEADKKRRSDRVSFVFVPRPGEAILEDIPLEELKQEAMDATGQKNIKM